LYLLLGKALFRVLSSERSDIHLAPTLKLSYNQQPPPGTVQAGDPACPLGAEDAGLGVDTAGDLVAVPAKEQRRFHNTFAVHSASVYILQCKNLLRQIFTETREKKKRLVKAAAVNF